MNRRGFLALLAGAGATVVAAAAEASTRTYFDMGRRMAKPSVLMEAVGHARVIEVSHGPVGSTVPLRVDEHATGSYTVRHGHEGVLLWPGDAVSLVFVRT